MAVSGGQGGARMWHIAAVLFVVTLAQCCALTYGALHIGRKFRILDFPDKQRKLHARATPRTGGVAIFLALVLAVAESAWLHGQGTFVEAPPQRFTFSLLASAALLCGLGLWDDKF